MRVLKAAGMLCIALAVLRGVCAAPPAHMQAAAIDAAGPAQALKLHTLAVPTPAADEVLIELDTAGVAVWDADIRARPDDIKHVHFPLVLGTDGAGRIAALGSAVHGFTVGEDVYAYSWDNPQGGFYAQYVAVPAERVARVPAGLTLEQAGAIGTTALTALQGIDDALHVKRGETVIIHGASGGVGTLAVQFAKLRGARVLAIASGDDGLALVRSLGADAAVDGRHGDVAAAARAFAPQGADALLALAGGEALDRALESLKQGGRVAYPTGVHPEPAQQPGRSVTRYDAIAAPAQFTRLNAAIVAARLQVPIAAEFPLAEAAVAHQRLESGHVLGKIVLRVR
jgi:NADPH:quinone reductase